MAKEQQLKQQHERWYDRRLATVLFVVGILILAGVFRFWQLDVIPPGLDLDEAVNANEAAELVETGDYSVFYERNGGREGIFVTSASMMFRVFGVGIGQLRAVSAVAGVLTVLGLFFFARELVGRNPALLASLLCAVSFWHVLFSRLGYRGILVPLFLVWAGYLLVLALRNRSLWYYASFGVVFGLGFYSYLSYRLFIFVVMVVIIAEAVRMKNEEIKIAFKQWLVVSAAVVVTALPLIVFYAANPLFLFNRVSAISFTSSETPFIALAKSMLAALGMFHVQGDPMWRYNIAGDPMLLWPVGGLFLLGLVVVLLSPRQFNSEKSELTSTHRALLFAWLLLLLLPAALTIDFTPSALRALGVVPVVCVFAALGGVYMFRLVKATVGTRWATVLVSLFLAALVATQFGRYFYQWATAPETELAYLSHHVELAEDLKQLPAESYKYIIVDLPGFQVGEFSIVNQSLKFLLRDTPNVYFLHPEEFNSEMVNEGDAFISLEQFEIDEDKKR